MRCPHSLLLQLFFPLQSSSSSPSSPASGNLSWNLSSRSSAGLVAIGVSAFAATNIDDIFVLMLFFSSSSFPVRHVILGQYLRIGLLIAISVVGSLIALVVPTYVIGLMGVVPIAIGVKNLLK